MPPPNFVVTDPETISKALPAVGSTNLPENPVAVNVPLPGL